MLLAIPLINILLWVVIIALIFAVVLWIINEMGLPAPYSKIVRVVLLLIFLILLLNVVGFIGEPVIRI